MTKKIQESKSLSKKNNKHQLTTKDASKGGKVRKVRVGDILTDLQGRALLEKAMEIALAGDAVLLKTLIEQKYGRPVATLEAKVDANIDLTMITYGQGTDTV